MPGFDDRLTRELERTARPADPARAFERVDRKRARRTRMRRVRAGALAVVVIAGTVGGFAFLSNAFKEPGKGIGAAPGIENGLVVYSEVRNAETHLWVTQPDGTGAAQLTVEKGVSDTAPSVSPDGRTVAFVRTDGSGSSVYTIRIDGSDLTRLTHAPALDPSWSPTGSQIAFAGGAFGPYGIWIMNADGTDPRLIPGTDELDVAHPTWSPDGRMIAFAGNSTGGSAHADWDVWTTDVEGITQTNITAGSGGVWPSWSPDGRLILFARALATGGSSLMTIAPDPDASPVALTDGTTLDQNPTWSPDGERVLFDRTWAGGTDAYTMNPDGSDLTLVARNATDPAWQPVPSGTPALLRVALPGGLSAMRLAIGEGAVWALGSKDQAGSNVLLRIDPATSQVVATIPLGADSWYLASGGGAVWVGSPRSSALQRVDAATNEVTAQIRLPGDGVSAVAADDQAVWVEVIKDRSDQGQQNLAFLVRIDAQTSEVVATIPLEGSSGYDDEVAIGAGAVWVAGVNLTGPSEERGADLVGIDTSTNTISAVIPVSAFSVRARANAIWVTSPADGVNDSLRKPESWVAHQVDPTSNEVSASIALPEAVSAVLAVTDGGVWFSGYDDQGLIHPVRLQGGAFDLSVPPINSVYSDMLFDEASGTIWIAAVSGLEHIDLE